MNAIDQILVVMVIACIDVQLHNKTVSYRNIFRVHWQFSVMPAIKIIGLVAYLFDTYSSVY